MARRTSKKWILAVLMAVVFPALAIHISCVAVIGPGTWGSGMEQKLPTLLPGSSNPKVAEYAREFSELHEAVGNHGDIPGLTGKVFSKDELPGGEVAAVATYQGASWVEDQHFYLVQDGQTTPLPFPSEMILEQPTLMKRGSATFVVVGRWQSWAIQPLEKLKRYLKSYRDPALQPEFSIYTYRLPGGPFSYWGPGHTLRPAPDRRQAILLRSGALGAGYYSLHLWDFERDRLRTVLSLREADPGSGRSFDYRWSPDSQALQITGTTGGFERRKIQPRGLNLIYLTGEDKVYDLSE